MGSFVPTLCVWYPELLEYQATLSELSLPEYLLSNVPSWIATSPPLANHSHSTSVGNLKPSVFLKSALSGSTGLSPIWLIFNTSLSKLSS